MRSDVLKKFRIRSELFDVVFIFIVYEYGIYVVWFSLIVGVDEELLRESVCIIEVEVI